MASIHHIIQSKVPHFVTLFAVLENHYGTISAACRVTSINPSTYYRMKQTNFLTSETARRILTEYQRVSRLPK